MMKRFVLLFSGILSVLTLAQERAGKEEEWLKALGASDFETRNAATLEIWGQGVEARAFLESLSQGDDPELAARGMTIARKIELGVTPETPEEIVQLIDQYFEATDKLKISVIERLLKSQEYDILLRLRGLEESPSVLTRIDAIIAEILPQIVRDHMNEGKVELALEYLTLSHQFSHLVQYAHLLDVTGGLDAEIDRLRESDSPQDQARYLACLRVKGDGPKLLEEGKRLGDRDSEVLAALTMGDHVPYLETMLETSNPTLPNRHYLNWTLANHRGDKAAEMKAYDALVYLSGQKSEQHGARMSLFRMGYGELVFEGLEPSDLATRVGYLLNHERYAEAQKLIGFPEGEGFDGWLDELRTKVKEEAEKSGTYHELDRLVQAIEFLEARGLLEKASKSALLLFDLVRPASDLDLSDYSKQIYYSAPVSTFTAIAREVDEHEAGLDEFLGGLNLSADESIWLFNRLSEVYPEMGTRERLLLALSFSARRSLVAPEQFTEARDRIIKLIQKEDDQVASLQNLFALLVNRNREEDLLIVLEALRAADSPDHYFEANVAIDGGRYQAGANFFRKLDFDAKTVDPEFLYRKGLAVHKAGMAGGGEMMEKAMLLSAGSDRVLRSFAMDHLRYGEVAEAYEWMRKALLRSENPAEAMQFGWRNAMIEELAAEAVTLGKWQEALAYREVAALDPDYSRASVALGIFSMRLRFQILIARGAIAMEADDVGAAVEAFSQAHEMLPSDGSLANDLFPLLRELGLHELHDQLFVKSARLCRENIRLYPKDDNACNNFAWMASRANRCLDEAEGYLKKALEMNPESAAYLDTMGEIYFARQDRESAVSWSEKSLKNQLWGSGSRWEIQYQQFRFQSGGFPAQ